MFPSNQASSPTHLIGDRTDAESIRFGAFSSGESSLISITSATKQSIKPSIVDEVGAKTVEEKVGWQHLGKDKKVGVEDKKVERKKRVFNMGTLCGVGRARTAALYIIYDDSTNL